jgi:hypothetical protein
LVDHEPPRSARVWSGETDRSCLLVLIGLPVVRESEAAHGAPTANDALEQVGRLERVAKVVPRLGIRGLRSNEIVEPVAVQLLLL